MYHALPHTDLSCGTIAICVVVALLAVALARHAAVHFSPSERALRAAHQALAQVRPRPLAELRDGEVAKVVGRVAGADARLVAPLSGRACACYEIVVEEAFPGRGGWSPRARKAEAGELRIVADDGEVWLTIDAARLVLVGPARGEMADLDGSDREREALLRREVPFRQTTSRTHIRYREGVVEEGARVAVVGVVAREANPAEGDGGYRDRPGRIVLAASADGALIVSDDPETLR